MNIRQLTAALCSLAVTAGGAVVLAAPAHASEPEGHCRYSIYSPYLSIGDTDASAAQTSGDRPVSQAQCELNSVLDRSVTYDGIFGSRTQSAVEAFQGCAHLSQDGIIGPNTWSALDQWFDKGWDCHK